MKVIRFFSLILILLSIQLTSASTLPILDDANFFNSKEIETLQTSVSKLRTEKNIWLVIQTIPSLNGLAIEDYSVHRFQELAIGQKKIDQGLLLVISLNDKKIRLEVGYGLEGVLPDILAKKIIDNTLRPFLKKNEPFHGTIALIDALMFLDSSEVNLQAMMLKDKNQQEGIHFLDLAMMLWIGACTIFHLVLIWRRGRITLERLTSGSVNSSGLLLALRIFEKRKFHQQILLSFVLYVLCISFCVIYLQFFPEIRNIFPRNDSTFSLFLFTFIAVPTAYLSTFVAYVFDSIFNMKTGLFIQSLGVDAEVKSTLRKIYNIQKIIRSKSSSRRAESSSVSSSSSTSSSSRSDGSASQGGRSGGGGASSGW